MVKNVKSFFIITLHYISSWGKKLNDHNFICTLTCKSTPVDIKIGIIYQSMQIKTLSEVRGANSPHLHVMTQLLKDNK